MPNKLYIHVEVFNLETDELVTELKFDYNDREKRAEYIKLFHKTLNDENLGIQVCRQLPDQIPP